MERQNPGTVRFMDWLNERMELLDEKIQNKATKVGEDYFSFFEPHAEEAYKEYYLYKCFRDLRQKARESDSPEKVLEHPKKKQNACLDTLLRQDITAYSTSPMANIAHMPRLECVQQLVEDYGHLIRIPADTLRQQEMRRDTRTLREKESRRGPKLQPSRPRMSTGIRKNKTKSWIMRVVSL